MMTVNQVVSFPYIVTLLSNKAFNVMITLNPHPPPPKKKPFPPLKLSRLQDPFDNDSKSSFGPYGTLYKSSL